MGRQKGESGAGSSLLRRFLAGGHLRVQEKVQGSSEAQKMVPWERHSAHCEQRVLVSGGSQALLHSLGCLCPELQGFLPKPMATKTSKTNLLYDREDVGLHLGKPRISHLCGLAWGKSNGETEC